MTNEQARTDAAMQSIAKKLSYADGFMLAIVDEDEITACSEERVTYDCAISMLKAMAVEVSRRHGVGIAEILKEMAVMQ